MGNYIQNGVNKPSRRESDYQYDPFGRRIKKSIKDDHDTNNEKTYWYGWDGDRLVTTETENQRINTIYHPGSFEPLVRIEQALPLTPKVQTLGEVMEDEMGMKLPKLVTDQFNAVEEAIRKDQLTAEQIKWLEGMMLNQENISEYIPKHPKQHPLQIHYYHCDQVGTPLALISDTGSVDWAIELDPFGNILAENGSDKIYQPIRMQGQQHDEETGLHYNRYRYYDPQTGRYISQDPIGLAGGMNNYIYPLNPNQAVDPRGLEKKTCAEKIVEAAKKLNDRSRYAGIMDADRFGFGERTNKCNLFIYEVLEEAKLENPQRKKFGIINRPEPIAVSDWIEKVQNGDLKNFTLASTPLPGDLVAIPFPYADATGHIAVILDPIQKTSIGANSDLGSMTGGWPWNGNAPQGTPVYIRCKD